MTNYLSPGVISVNAAIRVNGGLPFNTGWTDTGSKPRSGLTAELSQVDSGALEVLL
jgi:hypothetical protein